MPASATAPTPESIRGFLRWTTDRVLGDDACSRVEASREYYKGEGKQLSWPVSVAIAVPDDERLTDGFGGSETSAWWRAAPPSNSRGNPRWNLELRTQNLELRT